jgi:hypothetical protein
MQTTSPQPRTSPASHVFAYPVVRPVPRPSAAQGADATW